MVSFPHSSEPAEPTHEVRVVDGRFITAECTCGWRSAGRRARATVRAEARDHALLYADGRELAPELAVPDVVEGIAADA
jgi:hypothetical protein